MCLLFLRKRCNSISTPKKKYNRTVKCPLCEKDFDRNVEAFLQVGGRYVHQDCHDAQQAKTQPRRDLIEFICYLYGLKVPTGYILRQIKEFEEIHGFTVQGIHMTLSYFYDIRGNEVIDGTGIGIVEYVYEEAKAYYSQLSETINHNKKVKIDNTEEVIYIKPPKNREIKLIDLEGIL